ncbi:serine hydrolase domain-containing protein [Variovorax sp. DT-64]|uniref:serine hydrolase domain-containing protein n=1 Tax=Variovorax sp. DT-64 TaxID=3396160 RepID=UPI003F1AB4C5
MSSRRIFVHGTLAFAAGVGRMQAQAASDTAAPSQPSEWMEAAPEAHGFPPGGLERVLDSGSGVSALRSLLVVRNGVLVGERYYGGASRDDLLAVNSTTKSIVSILVGQALAQGKLKSLSQAVAELLPELAARIPDAAAASISVRQILTGTSGLAYDYRTQGRALSTSTDPAVYAFGLEGDGKAPGTWSYNDTAVALLSPILERSQGLSLAALAKRDLFAPLGIEQFSWERDKAGREFSYRGLRLRTRDLAKVAWTVADAGKWKGKEVVPPAWVEESTRTHTPGSWRIQRIGQSGYGYLWFTGQIRGKPVAWSWGYGGQFTLVAPSLGIAVATAASDPRPQDLQSQTGAVMALVAQVVELAA